MIPLRSVSARYFYEFTYAGEDTDNVIFAEGVYYVLFENVSALGLDYYDLDIVAQLDKNEAGGLKEEVYEKNLSFRMVNEDLGYSNVELVNTSLNETAFTYTLHNSHDRNVDGESNKKFRYVYSIEANGYSLYKDETNKPALSIDQDAWTQEFIACIKEGTLDIMALYQKYMPEYSASETLTLDLSQIPAGEYRFNVRLRYYGITYEEGESDDWCSVSGMIIRKELPTPTLTMEGIYGYVLRPEGQYEGEYVFTAYDGENNLVTIENLEWDFGKACDRFEFPYPGGKVKVKLSTAPQGESGEAPESYWLDSEWTDYEDALAVAVSAPTFTLDYKTLSWSVDTPSQYIQHYVYTLNGGYEQTGENCNLASYRQNVTVRVKAVASAAGKQAGYCDSAWVEYTYVFQGGSADGKS
ncbi:MAG: hypothetical protein E7363_05290 [Clostridiales bacterium]|nr:hypothetical protein [Clostridiales bacterium]